MTAFLIGLENVWGEFVCLFAYSWRGYNVTEGLGSTVAGMEGSWLHGTLTMNAA